MKELNSRELLLDDGSRIIARDEPEPAGVQPDHDYSNNVYRVSDQGELIWQIQAGDGTRGRAPFTGVAIDEHGRVTAFRWDGDLFAVDVDTGQTQYLGFVK